VHVAEAVALQRTEIIGVAEFSAQLIEDWPVSITAFGTELTFEIGLEVGLDAVVEEA
jgi:hypothetical protein